MRERTMGQILAELAVLSDVPAARAGDVIHGGEKHQAPRGPRESLYDEFSRRYRNAHGPIGREACRRDAERALESARRRAWGQMQPQRHTFEWRCRIADDMRDIKTVAQFYGVGRRSVSRYRVQYGGVMRKLTTQADERAA